MHRLVAEYAAMKPGAEAPGDPEPVEVVPAPDEAAMKPGAEAPGDQGDTPAQLLGKPAPQ